MRPIRVRIGNGAHAGRVHSGTTERRDTPDMDTRWIMDTPVQASWHVFERDATRYEVLVSPREHGTLIVALPNFGRAAFIGAGAEKYYVAEKLNVSLVDAQNIIDHALAQHWAVPA